MAAVRQLTWEVHSLAELPNDFQFTNSVHTWSNVACYIIHKWKTKECIILYENIFCNKFTLIMFTITSVNASVSLCIG